MWGTKNGFYYVLETPPIKKQNAKLKNQKNDTFKQLLLLKCTSTTRNKCMIKASSNDVPLPSFVLDLSKLLFG